MTTTGNAPATTGALQMIRAEVNVRDFQRWMGVKRLQDPDHAMHCLLTECFGDLAPKPFRLIVPRGAATGCLYGYGPADAHALREAAAICADPLQCRILPANSIDSKPMPTEWPKDKRLGFEVRIRPMVRLQRDLDRMPADKLRLFREDQRNGDKEFKPRPGMECDVFQWEALLQPPNEMARTREQVYAQWLAEHLKTRSRQDKGRDLPPKGGAALDTESVQLVSFQRTGLTASCTAATSKGPTPYCGESSPSPTPAPSPKLCARASGRHRAYGYGMLLLRPARRLKGDTAPYQPNFYPPHTRGKGEFPC